MSKFTDKLNIVHIGGGLYQTKQSFRFYYNDDLSGEYVEVPIGFISNGASFPKFIQKMFNLNPFDSCWSQAAFVHDALVGEYIQKIKVKDDFTGKSRYLNWSESTDWFDKALQVLEKNGEVNKECKCKPINRKMMIWSVKQWGKLKGRK